MKVEEMENGKLKMLSYLKKAIVKLKTLDPKL
jgi:hypothetical protein